ncbi:NDUFB7 isoform 1 [Pan troglodytes]|uniref:NADH dehydrogenase [ubiquinone] 1 beta subcomplex subunit 7 n=5 Tax=Hominidae TaxID=9604 RepID=NDUB7_GORGO|nr:NADH dehydrogenase [ubiquinone] 1 beta subcomplex subunit 7 [Pan paniscus]XP_030860418.1 NADH dehydrogenase [ubiquinone] 1 beta subcomplex subunit 7 [Gorilla gorilla gorilla]Q0MQE2.3 RecName: Full=NADH dehydrogenase [ubiquinone] 1 beta subcomplex subunit 7; AltName: Full=Complex I-B18; Short=CI-B18; AltName: Full=NADH-ubiquinone oxidoreductase B18 subunit [Pongo pygmaeus]Q0MQE3.3 RecName: Full=NADH dehydrogenase [ubiquinone] 1 beta subcomplex subunit 7; AltName: Full=Complex I-B18; Short=CI-B
MGAHLVRRYLGDASVEPDPLQMPTFPPDYGFPERKEREMVATQQEMMDAQLRLQLRDYCAHYLIRLLKCKRDSFPNFLACKQERHDWDYCEHRDYVMRMKEFERERRLLQRKKRREKKAAELAKGQGPGEVDPKVAL